MKERNCSLDMFRLFSAIIVVTCHTHLFKEINEQLYFSLSQLFSRFTVPFFFGVAGYYYIGALLKGKVLLKKQLSGLIKIYIAWTLVYYAASFGVNVVLGGESVWTFLLERVVFFFTVGSYSHMWYMVALIYAVIIITVAYKLAGEKGIRFVACFGVIATVLCALGRVYYPFGSKIPVLSNLYDSDVFLTIAQWFGMGIPYFSLGYFVQKEEAGEKRWSNKTVWTLWIATVVLFLLEILVVTFGIRYYDRPEVMISVYFLTIMNLIVLLRNSMPKFVEQAKAGKAMSTFVYFSHPLVILMIEEASSILSIPINSVILTVLVLAITCIGGYILSKVEWKIVRYFM